MRSITTMRTTSRGHGTLECRTLLGAGRHLRGRSSTAISSATRTWVRSEPESDPSRAILHPAHPTCDSWIDTFAFFPTSAYRLLRRRCKDCCALLRICLADFVLTSTRRRLVGSLGTMWSSPFVAQRLHQIVQGGGSKKSQDTPCNSLFNHDLIRPTLTPRKHDLTCANRTDLVIDDPHLPDGASHLIRGEVDGSSPLWAHKTSTCWGVGIRPSPQHLSSPTGRDP